MLIIPFGQIDTKQMMVWKMHFLSNMASFWVSWISGGLAFFGRILGGSSHRTGIFTHA